MFNKSLQLAFFALVILTHSLTRAGESAPKDEWLRRYQPRFISNTDSSGWDCILSLSRGGSCTVCVMIKNDDHTAATKLYSDVLSDYSNNFLPPGELTAGTATVVPIVGAVLDPEFKPGADGVYGHAVLSDYHNELCSMVNFTPKSTQN